MSGLGLIGCTYGFRALGLGAKKKRDCEGQLRGKVSKECHRCGGEEVHDYMGKNHDPKALKMSQKAITLRRGEVTHPQSSTNPFSKPRRDCTEIQAPFSKPRRDCTEIQALVNSVGQEQLMH